MDTEKNYNRLVLNHYEDNWGSNYQIRRLEKGPMKTLSKEFCLLEYPPNAKRKMWTYATCGMSAFNDDDPIEAHIFSPNQDEIIIEILTAVSYYHKNEAKINLNHTVNFGIPWQPGSKCSYGLISLPYLDGPNLEILKINKSFTTHFYWLIPITPEEVNYKKKFGVEALEENFDKSGFNYLDPFRKSVV